MFKITLEDKIDLKKLDINSQTLSTHIDLLKSGKVSSDNQQLIREMLDTGQEILNALILMYTELDKYTDVRNQQNTLKKIQKLSNAIMDDVHTQTYKKENDESTAEILTYSRASFSVINKLKESLDTLEEELQKLRISNDSDLNKIILNNKEISKKLEETQIEKLNPILEKILSYQQEYNKLFELIKTQTDLFRKLDNFDISKLEKILENKEIDYDKLKEVLEEKGPTEYMENKLSEIEALNYGIKDAIYGEIKSFTENIFEENNKILNKLNSLISTYTSNLIQLKKLREELEEKEKKREKLFTTLNQTLQENEETRIKSYRDLQTSLKIKEQQRLQALENLKNLLEEKELQMQKMIGNLEQKNFLRSYILKPFVTALFLAILTLPFFPYSTKKKEKKNNIKITSTIKELITYDNNLYLNLIKKNNKTFRKLFLETYKKNPPKKGENIIEWLLKNNNYKIYGILQRNFNFLKTKYPNEVEEIYNKRRKIIIKKIKYMLNQNWPDQLPIKYSLKNYIVLETT